jgi:hypothetical protein
MTKRGAAITNRMPSGLTESRVLDELASALGLVRLPVVTAAFRVGLALLVCLCTFQARAADALTDDEVRQRIIAASKAAYPGSCPCPENLDRAGRRCGMRSARSKPGGESVLCYPTDVTDEQVKRWRSRNES